VVKTSSNAGWYADPTGKALFRYFDGHWWTNRTADEQPKTSIAWHHRPAARAAGTPCVATLVLTLVVFPLSRHQGIAEAPLKALATSSPSLPRPLPSTTLSSSSAAVVDVSSQTPASTTPPSIAPLVLDVSFIAFDPAVLTTVSTLASPPRATAARTTSAPSTTTQAPSATTAVPATSPATTKPVATSVPVAVTTTPQTTQPVVRQPPTSAPTAATSLATTSPTTRPPATTIPAVTTSNAVATPRGVVPGTICGPPGAPGYTASGQLVHCTIMDARGTFFWSQPGG
jgi:hypothetical protein